MSDEFSVYWWDRDGGQHEEMRFASVEQVMRAFGRLTMGPASRLGMVKRVIVTDGGDCICAEWKDGALTFPPRATAVSGEQAP
jgi:hypothetical protein